MKRVIIWSLAIGLMLGYSSVLQAQEQGTERRPHRGAFVDEDADGLGDGAVRMHRRGGRGPGLAEANPLNEEQRAALEALVSEMKANEAAAAEIRAAVEGQLADWGIEPPERPEGAGFGGREGHVLVSEEQRAAIEALLSELKANEATPEEVRAALQTQLADLGIELPERPEGVPGAGKGDRGKRFKPGDLPEGWTPGDLPEGWTPGERPAGWGGDGESGATLRRAARKMDNKSVEEMMLRTQGRRSAE